ncbi:MAG: DUF3987 domain-containing protein [Candidatus Cloacimonetes bacterium]|nr:DUF3987 domain-containing protein [Candidatus Cloacimonadota bacterium]MDY0367519.1 DUF3987 domain-containing protein [Candidatus Syntrophosphaera sp.]
MEQTQINPLNLITFGKSITRPEAIETMPAVNLMAMLQAGQWRKPIEAIRKEKNPILQKEMKLRLPYFVYGVLEGSRSEENVRQVNGIVFDFDHVGEIIPAKQKLMGAAPWFRWLFRSPVDGLKLMIPFSRPVTDKAEYLLIWNLLKAEIEAKSGFQADNTPDLCRACFLSWDDDVITCPEEWLLDLDEWLREHNTESQRRRDGEKQGKGEKVADGVGRKVDVPVNQITGATDVPVGQGPEGLSGPKDKPLRGFANGDVCGSCNAADVCGSTITLDEVQAKSAVEYLAQRKLDRREWIRCGIALYNHFGEDGIVYWLQFAYNPNYSDTPEDLRKVWERLKKYPGVNIGTLFYIAEQNGWVNAITTGATDVPVGQGPEGLSGPKDKPLRGFANGDVCGSCNAGDVCGSSDIRSGSSGENTRKVDVPVDQKPAGLCGKAKGSLLRSEVDGDVNLPKPTLADFPELLDLFRRPQNIHLDRDQLPREIVGYLDLVGRITDAQDGAKLTAFLPVVAATIGNKVFMYNAGTRHYCNIWAAIIGPSTVSRKTTVINQAMKMLQPFKETLRELSPKERNEQDIELSRVTQARLYNLLAINPNRLILQMELSAWMREMGKSYNAGMKQEITDMFDGKDRSIAKMEIDEHIAKPAFSIVGATTEDWFFQELREVADQRGGFLQRFIICIIQNIDVNELRLASVDASDCDRELAAWDEMLAVFRSLPDSRRLLASEEAGDFRDAIYADLMKAIALNANDPQAAYCARIFDNYFWRFCILIFLLKNWRDLREARDNDHLQTWFLHNKVDTRTAKEAWYLCQYYYENTRPFLKQLTEGSKLDEERHLLKILQKAPGQELGHSRLLCKSRMPSRDFRKCVESLVERQAIIFHERDSGYRNRVSMVYSLNPVLNDVDIS